MYNLIMETFYIPPLPELYFGAGSIHHLQSAISKHGIKKIVLITGNSFLGTVAWPRLTSGLADAGVEMLDFSRSGEPTPEFVNGVTRDLQDFKPDAVLSVGGGSVIDAGKAVSAMYPINGSIEEYLEGVGSKNPEGRKIPFIAVPTTAGTGSEATKNAVISSIGDGGFKKSLRHDNYVPDVAIIDPELALSCSPSVTAASGLDAITQLLEAYVSTKANPFTDALALDGLSYAGQVFLRAVHEGDSDLEARTGMAYAAYLSGICLANAGLGVVHGIASPAGAITHIPHGVVCGTLLSESVSYTIERLQAEGAEENQPALNKYSKAGYALSGSSSRISGSDGPDVGLSLCVSVLRKLTDDSGIAPLGSYGYTAETVHLVSRLSGLKNHPFKLTADQIEEIMLKRL
jgi:alcohol dehydrogenase class IV